MLENLNREVYVSGEFVFKEGDSGDCAYIIESGRVEIFMLEKGNENPIGSLGVGEIFGEIALLDALPRSGSARCAEKTILIPVQRKTVNYLLEKADPIIRSLLLAILERYRGNKKPNSAEKSSASKFLNESEKNGASLRGEVTQKLALAHDIALALKKDQFDLYYQPICDLSTGDIAGYEALIRWNHPTMGLVPPLDFLWMAESTGQILELGLWTLERACRDWTILRDQIRHDSPFISVNLSANQLVGNGLMLDLSNLLSKYKVPAHQLKLELTESIFIENPDQAYLLLSQLTKMGCSLALDDYGTGYSGLNSLQRYPIATMKIDKSFISTMLTTGQSNEIVSSSIKLAHSLGMNVVAEGIETEEIYRSLIEMKCDFGQGWYFGRPAALRKPN
jgi:EAL domain-containing protein (putative c-di-GMP-specific phosphodiesterase class I)